MTASPKTWARGAGLLYCWVQRWRLYRLNREEGLTVRRRRCRKRATGTRARSPSRRGPTSAGRSTSSPTLCPGAGGSGCSKLSLLSAPERQLIDQLSYNLLFRWFTGLAIDDPVWDVTVFTKNRDRLLDGAIAAKFFQAVLSQPQVKALLSDEHFTVDGTLIEAFASLKSFNPKADPGAEPPAGGGRNAERDFHGERRSNGTHGSTTYPEARLLHKGRGKEAKLCFMGHLLMENRHGLIVNIRRSIATTPTRLAGR